jgi:hypothetical protein
MDGTWAAIEIGEEDVDPGAEAQPLGLCGRFFALEGRGLGGLVGK